MTTTPNPYAADLGDRDPRGALAETPETIRALTVNWSTGQWERSYAPGKWSARQLLVHLAQTELALPTRARFALSEPDYQAQSFNQDDWMAVDEPTDARTALEAYLAMRRFNLALFRRLTPTQLATTFRHPEYGRLTVGWILAQMAGHDIHHLKQLTLIES